MPQLTKTERRRLLSGRRTVQQPQRARRGEYLTWEHTDDGAVLSVNGQVERVVTFAEVEHDLRRLRGILKSRRTPSRPKKTLHKKRSTWSTVLSCVCGDRTPPQRVQCVQHCKTGSGFVARLPGCGLGPN